MGLRQRSFWPSLHGVPRCSLPHDIAETLGQNLAALPNCGGVEWQFFC